MDIQQFTPQLEQQFLDFIEAELAGSLHDYATIRGILFAISAAPEIPMPNEWLAWVFKNPPEQFPESTASNLVNYLISIFQHQSKLTNEENFAPPNGWSLNQTLAESEELCHWCYGWLIGHMHMEKLWTTAFDLLDKQEPEQGSVIEQQLSEILSSLTPFAEYIDNKQQDDSCDYQLFADKITKLAANYVNCANKLAGFLPNQFETFHQPVKRDGDKIGRNDPCVCGSGKKYKKCCGK